MDVGGFIPYGRQFISQNDIDAVTKVLKSDFLTQGNCVEKFEEDVCKYCNVDYAIAVNSATSALHIACLSLGLKKGDWLWTSPVSFVASANCGIYCGAMVDFVDIDSKTYNICPKALKKKLASAKIKGKLPKVVIPVHFSGQSCDMKAIYDLSIEYNFKIIEDASHAIGGKYLNKTVGNCEFSDIAIFSFHPVKIITTGEGGMAVTNEKKLAKQMCLHRSHGITRNINEMSGQSDGEWYYQQIVLGYNYRMTDIQASLGSSQIKNLEKFVNKRHELALHYNKALSDLPITLPYQDARTYSSFHLYVIRVASNVHKDLFTYLRGNNIGVNLHYIPIYRHPYFQSNDINYDNFSESELYYSEAISLPLYPSMESSKQDYVINKLEKYYE